MVVKDRHQWLGEEWEAYCLLLLRVHYGPENVQSVPSTHGGDLGIEAFTHDGCAIQCYAPRAYVSVQARSARQLRKLTEDLNKLEKYQDELLKLLGDVKIAKYLFMVPVLDSRKIVQHASRKTQEYRLKHLPHLHANFRVTVVTDDAFSDSRDRVTRQDTIVESLRRAGAILDSSFEAYDPVLDMGVHPPTNWTSESTLPAYVPRAIDDELDNAVKQGGLV